MSENIVFGYFSAPRRRRCTKFGLHTALGTRNGLIDNPAVCFWIFDICQPSGAIAYVNTWGFLRFSREIVPHENSRTGPPTFLGSTAA